jgi:hypothetical protein
MSDKKKGAPEVKTELTACVQQSGKGVSLVREIETNWPLQIGMSVQLGEDLDWPFVVNELHYLIGDDMFVAIQDDEILGADENFADVVENWKKHGFKVNGGTEGSGLT